MRLLNASGCLDPLTAPEVVAQLDVVVTKTVTPLPRAGNPPVRIAETDFGMLNSIGLANPGIEGFVADVLPRLTALGVPLWVSVGGFAAEEYAASCAILDEVAGIEALELNLSCPNVDEAAETAAEIVAACRAATARTLYAKLSPAIPDVGETVRQVEAAGADGISLVNTLRGVVLDGEFRPVIGRVVAGYSGPPLRPVALAAVVAARAATELPIVGMGGVSTGRHALELVACGANDVALGTTLFPDPGSPARIRAEIAAEIARLGVESPDSVWNRIHRAENSPCPATVA